LTTIIDPAELKRRYERRLQLTVPADAAFLKTLPLFAGVPEKARDKVIEKLRTYIHVVEYGAGDDILRMNDYSDSAYYIVEGAVEVVVNTPGRGQVESRPVVRGGAHVPPAQLPGARPEARRMVGRGSGTSGTIILSEIPADVVPGKRTIMEAGEIFGELSALSRYPVSATVRAATPVKLLQIRLRGLKTLAATSKEFKKFLDTRYRERTLTRHLRNVGIFSKLDDGFLAVVKEKAELVSFEPGQIIVNEGDVAESFFLLRGGYVKVGVRAGTTDLAITYLRTGDYAGEAALLLDETWPFTLQALEHVEVVKLGKDVFQDILRTQSSVQDELWGEAIARLKARGAVIRNPGSAEHLQMAMDTGLVHGESVLLIDLSTCTRCDECVRGCADAHEGVPRFIREGAKYRNFLVPTACYQCTDPVCMMDCPTGAITREVNTLEVTITEATCVGCKNCATRCPWQNIVMVDIPKREDGTQEVATKCDLCLTRPEGPACVQMCPHGSAVRISFKDLERVVETLK
jgi:CRP-like cAMP-binding protein/Fe-S-cluster-containing hydrogenase component 2